MKSALIIAACLALSSNAFGAECTTNAAGHTVCKGENEAVGVNRNTGNAVTSEKNPSGTTTTESSKGGKAVTKNGKGVYRAPSGKKCVKTQQNPLECQ